jgi:hypothetical protein
MPGRQPAAPLRHERHEPAEPLGRDSATRNRPAQVAALCVSAVTGHAHYCGVPIHGYALGGFRHAIGSDTRQVRAAHDGQEGRQITLALDYMPRRERPTLHSPRCSSDSASCYPNVSASSRLSYHRQSESPDPPASASLAWPDVVSTFRLTDGFFVVARSILRKLSYSSDRYSTS